MRIVIITPFYPPSIGGVENIARDTAEELARRGHEVSVITTTHNNVWKKISEPGVETKNGVITRRLSPSLLKVGYAALMKGLKEAIENLRPDLVHSHNLHPHLFQAVKWKDKFGYKVVAQLHYPEAAGVDHFSARLMYHMAMRYLKQKQDSIDAFVVHTNLEKSWLIGKGLDEKKVCKLNYPCVPSTLLKKREKYSAETARGLSMREIEKQILLYIGRLTRRKGVHTLLQALPGVISEVRDVITVIAGPADEKYYEMLLTLTHRLKLNSHVVFRQPLSEEQKYEFMLGCSVFVSPSIKDYTPVTLVEAQALGKPVVSTTVGAIPEIVRDQETSLLVEPENPEQLASAINFVVSNDRKRRAMGVKAKQWINENFLLEATIDRLENLYANLDR